MQKATQFNKIPQNLLLKTWIVTLWHVPSSFSAEWVFMTQPHGNFHLMNTVCSQFILKTFIKCVNFEGVKRLTKLMKCRGSHLWEENIIHNQVEQWVCRGINCYLIYVLDLVLHLNKSHHLPTFHRVHRDPRVYNFKTSQRHFRNALRGILRLS